ncbi:aminotransferase class V-fold PLP-dependent enzyme [Lysinibacter sp. HNR]|uniref:aminotransferase class V-fold PLP-dependent enzyme n=1 Tax=Lysinibacter sp. HNR TaxID=3031408 RepID=UPI002434FBC1|nr:aminotransferase class V-fold PLP-dependent enzyme [Lysinibacter sp. HNR]WGD37860.1 aminotransferase class V-fold PLP-dependent enzyme [Lysinibacter sp. HNR]
MTTPAIGPLTISQASDAFSPDATYLAACTLGLPTDSTRTALAHDLDDWARGLSTATRYGEAVENSRSLFAQLVHTEPSLVACGSQVSSFVSVVATSVPDNAEILCVDGDFSSVAHPFVQQAYRGVTVRFVPLAMLAQSIRPSTHLVAFSLVQSATGEHADSEAICSAAQAHNALTLCDLTQAAGWMPVYANNYDITVTHTYKWLCVPRGVAFMTVQAGLHYDLHPIAAGWYSADNVWGGCYTTAMSLAPDARRFDLSPAWPAWIGAQAALDFFTRVDMEQVRQHSIALGNRLCQELDLPQHDQAIVTWPDADGSQLTLLTEANIVASNRAGRLRAAFHLWNTAEDIDQILTAIRR